MRLTASHCGRAAQRPCRRAKRDAQALGRTPLARTGILERRRAQRRLRHAADREDTGLCRRRWLAAEAAQQLDHPGQVGGLYGARRHVWIYQRPRTLTNDRRR